jgi:hypothetical protein
MKHKWIWTLILSLIVIADSFLTIYIGVEMNPIILWVMDIFNLSLEKVMYLRLLYIAPFIYIVHRWNYIRCATLAYISVYITGAIYIYVRDLGMII